MYVSIQTVCGCHGYLIFESIHCDRCRSLIPYQLTDESLTDPGTPNFANGIDMKAMQAMQAGKHASNMLVPYRKPHHHHHHHETVTTGRVRFRALCPFCNSPTYVLRYFCKRERIYYHLRIQNFGETDQVLFKSIAETQNMSTFTKYGKPRTAQTDSSLIETVDDSYSISGSTSHQPPSTVLYDQSRVPNMRDIQIENEKKLYQLNELEGDLFNVLRNGLFYDTMIQCQDDVKIQVHRCILGGRSPWFRHLLGEYHDSNTQEDYVLQISIDDVQSDVMNEILNFMYTNRCLISLKNAPDLLVAAKRFELERLTKQIADFLLSRLTVDNAIEMFISAHESGSEALKLACIRVINRNAEKIKRTDKWRQFKAQYVDLVPELYENRIEHPEPAQQAFLPDVFSAPAVPSDSLLTLSKLYENPIKQRLPSPPPRILPPPSVQSPQNVQPPPPPPPKSQPIIAPPPKSQSILAPSSTKPQQVLPPPPSYREPEQVQTNHPITQGASGHFVQRNDSELSSASDRRTPKKRATSMTRQRPTPGGPILTRNIFPTVKQTSDADAYRRPVNVYEKSVALPNNPQKQSVHTQMPQKPPPQAPTKVSRAVSPRRVIEIRRTPSLNDLQPEESVAFGRVVSVETMD